jgi:penicillin G amidase
VPPGTVVAPGRVIPPATLIVPRRNNGPIVNLDTAAGAALSVQFTGFSGTRELDAFAIWNRARSLDDFIRGLQFFDFGSQNWTYADVEGNVAYFTSGEMPLREDLQAGRVDGLPPFFIRVGTGGNEWLPVANPQPGQAIPFETLPFDEMPQIVNPQAGFLVNANNDPVGTSLDNNPLNQLRPDGGIFYLNPGYDAGMRAGRITQMIRERLKQGSKISLEDAKAMQADTVMLDAQVFLPRILTAFKNATSGGSHPILAAFAVDSRMVQAVGRMQAWDFSTPTGIPEGFDASDVDGKLLPPSQKEIDASIAATIYSVWRGQIIRNTIDAALAPLGLPPPGSREVMITLRHLLDNFETNQGMGASGLDFFNVPDVVADPATRRDILLLKSLADALDLLVGDTFKAAFNNSPNQDDYRWGRLHRIVFRHPLDGPFSVPPAGGFMALSEALPGIPTDGGFQVVDSSGHSARADDSGDFTFDSGPVNRFVSEMKPGLVRAESSLPGGESGVLGSPFYANLLGAWLTNDTFRLQIFGTSSVQIFLPGGHIRAP